MLLVFACSSVAAWAFDFGVPMPERPQGFVNDYANAMTQAQRQQLEQRFAQIQQKGLATITVLVVKNLNGHEIAEYSIKVAELWKVGKKGVDNGVLITIATEERGKNGKPGRRRIEVGRGLNGVLTDLMTGRINKASRETFDRGEMAASLNQMADGIEGLLAKEKAAEAAVSQPVQAGKQGSARSDDSASSIFGIAFAAIAALLVIALGGNFVIKRINRNRERKASQLLQAELIKAYDEALEETGKLACAAEKALLAVPELAKAKGQDLLLQIRKRRNEISDDKGRVVGVETSYWLRKQSAGVGAQLKGLTDACKEALSRIEQLPAQLEQKFIQAEERIEKYGLSIAEAKKSALELAGEGYVVDTRPLSAFEAEVASLKATIAGKLQHPDDANWRHFDDGIKAVQDAIEAPKKSRNEAAALVKKNSDLFVELSPKRDQIASIMVRLRSGNPAEVWQEVSQRFGKVSQHFDSYITMNSAALKANQIPSEVADYGHALAKAAKFELDTVKTLFKEIEELDGSLEKARNEHVAAFSEAEQAYKRALSAVKEEGVKPETSRRVNPLEGKLVEANRLISQVKQGGMVNLLVLMALIAEISREAKRVTQLSGEETKAHLQHLRQQERLRQEREEAIRRENQRAILAVTVDDDDSNRRNRGGGGGISIPDSAPAPEIGGGFDSDGADD
jgi:uncharacterized membrane protein YgcG